MTYIKFDTEQYLNYENYKKIIRISGEKLELDDNTFILTEKNYPEIIDNIKHNAVYDTENQIIIKKTEEMKQQELIEKQSAEILNNLLSLMTAMNIQENGKNKGANPTKAMFTDQEIQEWSEYIADIAVGNISTPMPKLNNIAKKIFKL
jgi:hypothetical protein